MKKLFLFPIALFVICTLIPEKKKIKIFMAGDSTMAIKETKAYPETGWGMPFVYFWDSTVMIVNRAKNGRSTKTFISEGLWKSIYDEVQPGDYVIIQFGHNDESPDKKERYATPDTFRMNLTKFVRETKEKGATPILFTPVSRRKFDSTGTALETHKEYSAYVKEVGAKEKVLLIDLDTKSRELYQEMGKNDSKLLFMQLKPGEHPNYPDGKDDNTHFTELGARWIAEIVLKELRNLNIELTQRIYIPPVKK
jgi:lysophospholipase L1-like esterase